MFKNVVSPIQSVTLFAVDASTGLPKTGDSANMIFYVSKDDGSVAAIAASSGVPTEVDATNAKGLYKIALAQAETNGDKLLFSGKSTTANVVVVPTAIYTDPPNYTTLDIDVAGTVNANVIESAGQAVFNSDGTLASATASTLTFPTTDSAGNAIPDDNRYAFTALQVVFGTGLGQIVVLTTKSGVRTFNILSGSCPVQLDNTSQYVVLGSAGTPQTGDIYGYLTTALTESYAAKGATGTLAQILYAIQQKFYEVRVNGTVETINKLDGTTPAMTETLNDAVSPTSVTRAT